ncbi:MAG TPA: cupin domain-containing protein [Anaerolineales bacterium]|nr:cupin domain-containing protein [Anaerolineales bacterium]
MYFHSFDERAPKELAPGINARTFWGEKMLAAVVELEANVHLPLHSHPHEQVGIVIDGQIEMTVAGEKKTLTPGDVYVIPGNVEHEARTFDQPVKVMDVFSPVRDEYKY